jgi:hypothetical protein
MVLFLFRCTINISLEPQKTSCRLRNPTRGRGHIAGVTTLPHLPLIPSLQPIRQRIPINSTCCPRAVWTQAGDRPGAVLTAGGRAQSQISRLRRKQPTRRGRRVPLLPPAPGALPEPPPPAEAASDAASTTRLSHASGLNTGAEAGV